MATRPTEDAGWAEGTDANIKDPGPIEQRGFQDPDSFASAFLNEILNLHGNWIQYFDDKFGGSTGAVDFFENVIFSDNGNVDVTNPSDTDSTWTADFDHPDTGGRAELEADDFIARKTLVAQDSVSTDILGPQSAGLISIADSLGQLGQGVLRLDTIEAPPNSDVVTIFGNDVGTATLELDALTPTGSGDTISLSGPINSNFAGLQTSHFLTGGEHQHVDISSVSPTDGKGFTRQQGILAEGNTGDTEFGGGSEINTLELQDNPDDSASTKAAMMAFNAPKVYEQISGFSTASQGDSLSQLQGGYGISSATYNGTGEYTFNLDRGIAVSEFFSGHISIQGTATEAQSYEFTFRWEVIDADTVKLHVGDEDGAAADNPDGPIIVHCYYQEA